MSALLPAAFYGLQVPGGDVAVEANIEFPAAIRITMAAIDVSEEYEPEEGDPPKSDNKRCVLKIIRLPYMGEDDDEEDSEFDSDEEEQLRALINGEDSEDEEDDSDDEELHGGPSDPEKSKKAKREAAAKALKAALESVKDDEMVIDGPDAKGKGKILVGDDSDEDDEDEDGPEIEEFVLCTLDTESRYQQTLDITIGEKEQVLFKVTGNYAINLTGNYVMPVDDRPSSYYDEEDESYDLSPDEDELDLEDLEDSEDELDDLEDPRITELESDDDEEVPKLVETGKKGKKRPADEVGLDDIIDKSIKSSSTSVGAAEPALSKKQLKKLKNNAGQAVATSRGEASADSPASKKVQFAKNLEQGPTGSTKQEPKKETKKEAVPATTSKIRTVNGVSIDDRKSGKGPAAKSGSRVSMRYIGKLVDGKVFDSNKSGKPFTFKLGAGEVIKGWDIGIEGMQAGSERRITVPADKAYGKKKLPGIPPNSVLIFDVKCLEVK